MNRTSPGAPASGLITEGRMAGLSRRAAGLLEQAGHAIDRRDMQQADRVLGAALALAPDHPEVLRLLGVGYLLAGRHSDAVATLRRALKSRPDDPLLLNNLGSALRDSGDSDAAVAMFREACARAPTLAAAWFNLGNTLKGEANTQESCDAFAHALALAPEHVAARVNYANALRALGRIDEALVNYREALRTRPADATAWLGLTNIKTVKLSAEETSQLQRCHAQLDIDQDDRAMIGFALATALEHQGRFAEAFETLRDANAARARTVPWDAAEFSGSINAIAAAFPEAGENAGGALGEEVIFVVSLPRSGSTLTEQIISSHPDVEGAGELGDLGTLIEMESTRRAMPFPDWVADTGATDWQRLGRAYLERTQRWRRTRPRFTDKALGNWQYLGAAARMLPGARFVDCRRDPVETCLSCYRQWFGHGQGFTYDLDAMAAYWHDYRRLMHHWKDLWPERIHLQDYEALLADPERQVRALLDACGLQFDPACMNFHENTRAVRTASAAQVRQPLRRDTARAE
ncbi:MAG: sulfotransferase, partial [Rhodanobacteraceae bacterium]